jgi:hypothetical protein
MTLALLITAAWLLGAVTVVAVCRAAARGDRALTAQWRRFSGSHEFPLAA